MKTNFVKLQETLSQKVQTEDMKNLYYSLGAKTTAIFRVIDSIEKDCDELERIWENGFYSAAYNGKFTKFEPKDKTYWRKHIDISITISANIDILFYLVMSCLDILAKNTREIYIFCKTPSAKSLPNYTFPKQKDWLIKHPAFDKPYSDYLKATHWIDAFDMKRDVVTHRLAPLILQEKKFGNFNVIFIPNLKTREHYDVRGYWRKLKLDLSKFLEFYGQHFLTKITI